MTRLAPDISQPGLEQSISKKETITFEMIVSFLLSVLAEYIQHKVYLMEVYLTRVILIHLGAWLGGVYAQPNW